MTKTIYENFKEFTTFYNFLKPRFAADFRPKDKIGNIFISRGVYESYKHDTYYGEADQALNKIASQIVFDCAEIAKKETIHAKHPEQTPNFQLYTVYRLEKIKVELEKELKKTSGVFKDKINLRLTFTESLIEGFKKEIKMLPVGNPEEKLSLGAKIFADFVDGYNDLVEEGLQDKIPSQMFLLLGPPGVGKSFISEMIAEATDLPIETISMNGMIKHKSRVVIFLLDEFEKCDKQVQKVLGNLTDKTLNKKFKDVFYDRPIPINQLIFFCTANYPEDIEQFLLSRLTPVKIQPATYYERIEIAQDLIDYNFSSYKIKEVDNGDPQRNRPACPYSLDRNAEHRKVTSQKAYQRYLELIAQGNFLAAEWLAEYGKYGLIKKNDGSCEINISPKTLKTKHSTDTRYGPRGAGFLPTTTHEVAHVSHLVTHHPNFQP
ncbi:8417_t:CDS:2 [Ambispora leptoticha]|uniref:8417_t:CDS:1 n=1 Tax=Ambispora leptoticha TaxID=144679 RepID=A0A9N8V819_9GLOM|nr:8417_t:CDS:2 [Ambispora leptoticha]